MKELLAIWAAVAWISGYNFIARPVKTFQMAAERGTHVARKLFPNIEYYKYKLNVEDEGDEFAIFYSIPSTSVDLGDGFRRETITLGGGGPAIHINKTTGKITYWGLQG